MGRAALTSPRVIARTARKHTAVRAAPQRNTRFLAFREDRAPASPLPSLDA